VGERDGGSVIESFAFVVVLLVEKCLHASSSSNEDNIEKKWALLFSIAYTYKYTHPHKLARTHTVCQVIGLTRKKFTYLTLHKIK